MAKLSTIGFDADDTLWHNEKHFHFTKLMFLDMLKGHLPDEKISERLITLQKQNFGFYGFGVKGYVLSMIETAIDITAGKIPSSIVKSILCIGQEMLKHPVELLPHAEETLQALQDNYKLILITKGDLFDQERKIATSGLGKYFHAVEIVSDKTQASYARIFSRHGTGAQEAVMVGNSLKSDVIPAIAAGAWGVHVPHEFTAAHEVADVPENPRFHTIRHLQEFPKLLELIA